MRPILLQQLLEPTRSWVERPSLWGAVGEAGRVERSEKIAPGPLVVVDGGPKVGREDGVPDAVDLQTGEVGSCVEKGCDFE